MPSSVATVDAARAPARHDATPARAATVPVVAAPPAAGEPIDLVGPERGTAAPPGAAPRPDRGTGRTLAGPQCSSGRDIKGLARDATDLALIKLERNCG